MHGSQHPNRIKGRRIMSKTGLTKAQMASPQEEIRFLENVVDGQKEDIAALQERINKLEHKLSTIEYENTVVQKKLRIVSENLKIAQWNLDRLGGNNE